MPDRGKKAQPEGERADPAGSQHVTTGLLDEICDYFGVKVAMYFSWMGFYTSSLVYPAVFGMRLWIITESDQEFILSIKELPRVVRFFPKILLAVIVSCCGKVYRKITYWLNDSENDREQSAYEKHLIIKIVLFQFVNSYLSLFYIGFYLKDLERLKEEFLPRIRYSMARNHSHLFRVETKCKSDVLN